MLINPLHELYVFVSAFLCGQVICILFDALRAIRKNIVPSVYTVSIHDIAFCCIAFFLVYRTFTVTNNGEVRWYELISLMMSCIVYFLSESRYVLRILTVFFSWFIKPIKLIAGKIKKLINIVKNRIFARFFGYLREFSKKSIKKLCKTPKNEA